MTEYLLPGVFVEELPRGPRPIEGASTSIAGFAGETERGPLEPALIKSWEEYIRIFGGYVDRLLSSPAPRYLPYAVHGFFENGGQDLYVARVVGAGSNSARIELAGGAGVTSLQAIGPGTWGNNILLSVKPATRAGENQAGLAAAFRLQIMYFAGGIPDPFVDPMNLDELTNPDRRPPDVIEDYDDLSADPSAPNYAPAVVNAASQLVRITACACPPDAADFPSVRLQGGTSVEAARDDYRGNDGADAGLATGLAALTLLPDVSLLAAPDEVVVAGLTSDVIECCERQRDRFCILSMHDAVGSAPSLRPPRDAKYGAIYFPWIRVSAPHLPGGSTLVPPAGHIAGIYARVDRDRGVHAPPTNEVIYGITADDIGGLSHFVTGTEQDLLNPRGVNVIRDFTSEGRGIRVWGARTMTIDAEWKYINVRRLFLHIERSLDRGLDWVVSEPNDDDTWASVRSAVIGFLHVLWRSGALAGSREQEAFFVKCDRATMTASDLEAGRLVCLVGVAPVRAAEFVLVRIAKMTAGDGQGDER